MSLIAFGQNCDLPLRVIIPGDIDGMSEQSSNYMNNVVRHLFINDGSIGVIDNSQFGIIIKSDIIGKEIIAGAPQKTILNINLSFYMGDIKEGKLLSSFNINVNGVGNNETKAFNNAIRKITPYNDKLKLFVENGKAKIINYYDNNYLNIIKKAKMQASIRNYEEALYNLFSIPECCKGYDMACNEIKVVYRQFVNRQCEENLAQAQAAWMSGFNKDNATIASVFLSEIYPDADCYKDAQNLVNEIKKHMCGEWNFLLKQWDTNVSIAVQQNKHAMEIALAFAKNQPKENITVFH